MSEITASEQIRLDIIKKVNYDTAAAKLAIDWVGDSYLKSELFADSFDRVFTESEIVSKTRKAIQEATEALALFDTAAEQVSYPARGSAQQHQTTPAARLPLQREYFPGPRR